MVDDLLDVTRLERGKLQLQRTRVDLNALAKAAIESCLPAVQSGKHVIKIDLAREPLFLDADPGEITVNTAVDGTTAVLSVRDSGIGLSAKMAHDVFLPFFQDDRTLARTGGGLGIGLTIARRLAELHGGNLQASSEGRGKGSTFTARLPLASAHETGAEQAASERLSFRCRRVVIVEDNADIRESLRIILEVWGHEVASAGTGQQRLELVRRINPDVALIDIGLPGMDGYEVAQP